jgi:hypothetical protein
LRYHIDNCVYYREGFSLDKEIYLLYIQQTVSSYSTKTKQHLLKQMVEKKIAIKDDNINGQFDIDGNENININGMSTENAIAYCLERNDEAIKLVEHWEFIKDYKYSVLFTSDQFDKIVQKIQMLNINENIENDYLFTSFRKPVVYWDDERYYLKYNLAYSAIHPITREELLLKYPILIVLHKKSKIIEFRYDVLRKVFVLDQEQDSYVYIIDSLKAKIEKENECSITGLNLDYMVSVANQNDDIKLIAQYMRFNTGQYAQLEVGNNQEYMLPLIGELKTILLDYQEELEKVPVLKDTLDQFMYEKEEMSDYPWIEVLWENDIKTRSIHVKFVFNYMNKDYGLIQHYYSNVLVGMERMNYVVEYIDSNRNNSFEKTE